MKIVTIYRNQLTYLSEGHYGAYSKLKKTKMGVKELFAHNLDNDVYEDTFDTISELKRSDYWKATLDEYNRLVQVAKITPLVPRPRGMVIIKTYCTYKKTYKYTCGYRMTHIRGKLVGDIELSHQERHKLVLIQDKLSDLGVILDDDHGYNVMKSKNRFIFIDAGRFYIM